MGRLFWLFGIDMGLIFWLKSLAKEEFSTAGFIQAMCLICLSTMVYAEIMRAVIEIVSKSKE
jgi:hypothetical protein